MNTDWHDLIQRHIAGLTTEEEAALLQNALKRDDAVARLYLRYMNLDVALEAHAASSEAVTEMLLAPDASIPGRSTRWLSWRPLAAAAVVLLFAGLGWWLTRAPEASLRMVEGEVKVRRGAQTLAARQGMSLKTGDVVVTHADGAAELGFANEDTSLRVGAEAELALVRVRPAKELHLRTGRLSASVAHQAEGHPMLVRTPMAKAEVLGTKFDLNAEVTATRMSVSEGRVLIARNDDASGVIVETAQLATVSKDAPVEVTAPPVAQSLLAHWRLDGDGADASPQQRALTIGDGAVFASGHAGRALDLHAANADAESPRITFPPVFTLALWLRLNPGGVARVQPIMGFSGEQRRVDDFWLTLEPNFPGSHLVFDVRGPQLGTRALSAEHVVRAGQWHHVAVVADSPAGRASFFVDGREVSQVPGLRREFKLNGALLVGHRNNGGTLPFDGQLDDIRIYGRALTGTEVGELFSKP